MGSIPCGASCSRWELLRRSARIPPWMPGRRVLTRPSIPPLEEQSAGMRQQVVLDAFYLVVKARFVVFGGDLDGALVDDRAVIDEMVHEMDRRAGHLHPGRQRVAYGAGAGERGQEGRMEVDEAAGESVDEGRGQDTHEPGRDHEIGPVGLNQRA